VNTQERAAAQAALEALEYHTQQTRPIQRTEAAILGLRAVLAQPTTVMLAPSDKLIWRMIENAQRISGVRETVAINYAMRELADKVIGSMSLGVATEPAQPDTVPWPVVSRYSGGASAEGVAGRVWIRLGDGPEEVEYRPTQPQDGPAVQPLTPLTLEQTDAAWRIAYRKGHTWHSFDWFEAGVEAAEAAHGIGGEHD
jgi:hypothetical protein